MEFASGAEPARAATKPTRLHDPVERAPIDHQILDQGKWFRPERLDHDRGAVLESPHVNFAGGARMIGAMRFAVDRERAGAADAFATIRIERDRLFAAADQAFVHDIEHFEKRRIRGNVGRFVLDELALRLGILLPPDFEFESHDVVERLAFCHPERSRGTS